jgi:hypothetical protein
MSAASVVDDDPEPEFDVGVTDKDDALPPPPSTPGKEGTWVCTTEDDGSRNLRRRTEVDEKEAPFYLDTVGGEAEHIQDVSDERIEAGRRKIQQRAWSSNPFTLVQERIAFPELPGASAAALEGVLGPELMQAIAEETRRVLRSTYGNNKLPPLEAYTDVWKRIAKPYCHRVNAAQFAMHK